MLKFVFLLFRLSTKLMFIAISILVMLGSNANNLNDGDDDSFDGYRGFTGFTGFGTSDE